MAEVKPLEPTEKIDAKVDTSALVNQLTKMGAQENPLVALGSEIAQRMSNERARNLGYEQGASGEGQEQIPISESAVIYNNAFRASAANSLNQQFQLVSAKAQAELSKTGNVTNDSRDLLLDTMRKSADSLLEKAPASMKKSMKFNFDSNIGLAEVNINNKMTQEQKVIKDSQISVDSKVQSQNAYSIAFANDLDGAKIINEESAKRSAAFVLSGDMTPEQAYKSDETNIISMWSGYYSGRAVEASVREKSGSKDEEGMLSRLMEAIPAQMNRDGVPEQSQQTILKNIAESLKSHALSTSLNESIHITEFNKNLAAGTTGPGDFVNLKKNVSTDLYKKSELSFIKKQNTGSKDSKIINNILTNPGDGFSWSVATSSQKDKALMQEINNQINSGKVTKEIAISQSILHFQGPTTLGKKIIEDGINSINSDDMESSIKIYDSVRAHDSTLVSNISQEAINKMEVYKNQKSLSGNSEIAIQKVLEQFAPKDTDQQKLIDKNWTEVVRNKYSTAQSKTNAGKNAAGDSVGKTFMNGQQAGAEFMRLVENNYSKNSQDLKAAINTAEKKMQIDWGFDNTWSGRSNVPFVQKGTITKRPFSREMGLPEDHPEIAQSLVIDHLKDILPKINLAGTGIKIDLIPRAVSYEDALGAKQAIDARNMRTTLLGVAGGLPSLKEKTDTNLVTSQPILTDDKDENILRDYQTQGNIGIRVTNPDGSFSNYEVYLDSSGSTSTFSQANKTTKVGNWNVMAIDEKGHIESLSSLTGVSFIAPLKADPNEAQTRYLNLYGLDQGDSELTLEQSIEKLKETGRRKAELKKRFSDIKSAATLEIGGGK